LLCSLSLQSPAGDDGMLFSSDEVNKSKIKYSRPTVQVKLDTQNGQIFGWDSLFKNLDMDKNLQPDVSDFDAYNLIRRARPGELKVSEVNKNDFLVSHPSGLNLRVNLEQSQEGQLIFNGLPREMSQNLAHQLTDSQIKQDPLTALKLAVRDISREEELPDEAQLKSIFEIRVKKEDPSRHYDIVESIGSGAFATVYRAVRISDQMVCALKVIRVRNSIQTILNEIGLMMLCQESEAVIQCYDIFEYMDKAFVFLELMDGGALNELLARRQDSVSEEFCKYVAHCVLQGIKALHDRHVIHRDIKSDNVLISSKGDVKLADFGFATMLTQQNQCRESNVGTTCWMAPELFSL
jgi:p21-activated kinase 2